MTVFTEECEVASSLLGRLEAPQFLDRLVDPRQCSFLPKNLERLKQRWGILAAADSYANRLEHLPRFYAYLLSCSAEGLVQGIVLEFRLRQDFPGAS